MSDRILRITYPSQGTRKEIILPDPTGRSSAERARILRDVLSGLTELEREALVDVLDPFLSDLAKQMPLAEMVVLGDLDRAIEAAEGMAFDLFYLRDCVRSRLSATRQKGADLWRKAAGIEPEPDHNSTEPSDANGIYLLCEIVAFVLRWEWGRRRDAAWDVCWRLTAARAASGCDPARMVGRTHGCMTELLCSWVSEFVPALRLTVALKEPLLRARETLKPEDWRPEDESGLSEALAEDATFQTIAAGVSLDALRAYLAHKLRSFDGYRAVAEIRGEFGAAVLWGQRLGAAVQHVQSEGENAAIDQNSEVPAPAMPSRSRISVGEANIKASRLMRDKGRRFTRLSETKQADLIGCSWQTWSRTKLYRKLHPEKAKQNEQQMAGRGASSPNVESLTINREATLGEGQRNEVLNQLIADQEAEYEQSPLQVDAPDRPPKKVYERKRR